MLGTFFVSILCGILSVFQVQLYLTPKNKWIQFVEVTLITVITWIYLCPFSSAWRNGMAMAAPICFLPAILFFYKEKIFCKLHNLFVQAAAASTCMLLGKAVYPVVMERISDDMKEVFVPAVFLAGLVVWTVSMWYLRNHSLKVEPYDEITYIQGFIQSLIAYGLSVFCCIEIGFEPVPVVVENLPLIYAFICTFLVIYTITIFAINKNLLIKHKMIGSLSAQRDFFKKQIEVLRNQQHNARILKHDIDKYIELTKSMYESGDYKRAARALDELAQRSEESVMQNYCDDTLINTILTDYEKRAHAIDAEFCCTCRIDEEISIQDLDLSAILFNSLDNAIESCEKIRDTAERKIETVLFTTKGYFVIQIINSYSIMPVIENNHILTTKRLPGEYHGIGFASIDMVTDRYNGRKKLMIEDGMFKLEVILKNERCSTKQEY